MIPRSRPVINESDIARQAGIPLATWRRRDAPAFRQRVASLFPSSRILIYDLAQAHAHLNGLPIPALPVGEHPDDLLNDEESATLLGVAASTVRAYATQGYLSAGTTVYSVRVWTRRDVEERRNNPPGQGKGGGRPPGKGKGPRKAHSYEGDPRLQTAAAALSTAEQASRHHLAAALAHQHGGSTRTWERLLAQASQVSGPAPAVRRSASD
ncbi:DNA-binding protein [Streptomyces sp. MS1.AVA.4]|uniref:DNA-binding protein n=1 Tax=Streptomyces pratisoli TaxID=3139917 RepID=A0ACC6QVG6_9ACTN